MRYWSIVCLPLHQYPEMQLALSGRDPCIKSELEVFNLEVQSGVNAVGPCMMKCAFAIREV